MPPSFWVVQIFQSAKIRYPPDNPLSAGTFLKFGVQTNRIKISLLSLQDIQRNVKGIADALDKKSGVEESISSGDRDRDAAIDKMVRAKFGEGWDE